MPHSGYKLLLIDDDSAIAPVLAIRLRRHFTVIATSDPRQAVAMARAERPDVILCDINMPGMNGDEVAFALSEDAATQTIPLVYLTGLLPAQQGADLAEPVELGENFGGHMAVSKAADADELLAVIGRAMQRR